MFESLRNWRIRYIDTTQGGSACAAVFGVRRRGLAVAGTAWLVAEE